MATNLPLPVPPLGSVSPEEWRAFLNSLTVFTNTEIPPIDGQYWVSESNPTLTDEINLGALPSGWLKITTAIGRATPSTQAHIPGGDLSNGSVTNPKLANMAQSTIKGRAALAGTGVPQDLTATQATAILDNVVGDSGAGGVKGLAPAPAAGDAAAGKFLRASGVWAVPSGTGINQLTGDVTAGPGAGFVAATIANQAVTFAKMQNIATQTLIGRNTAGTASPESVTISQALDWLP